MMLKLFMILILLRILCMTRKLLIAAGDSWTNKNERCYEEAGMTEVWSDYVGKFLDMEVLNIGHGGAGNEYILNKTIDAIEENSNRDIVIMVGWSQAHRIVPYELCSGQITHTVGMPEYKPPFGIHKKAIENAISELARLHIHPNSGPLITEKDFWKQVGNMSMRAIYMLNNYCENKNIPIIHGRALHPLVGIEWITRPDAPAGLAADRNPSLRNAVLEECKKSVYWKKIQEFKNVIGDPDFFKLKSSWYDVYRRYWIHIDERHPNNQGMQLIAQSFVNKYLELYGELAEEEPFYVYD